MRLENTIYDHEMSAYHYFRDFAYHDSGMIPWLPVAELMSTTSKPLSNLSIDREAAYFYIGNINYQVADAMTAMRKIEKHFASQNPALDCTNGISLEFADCCLNLRSSNTEPFLRLNVESFGDATLLVTRVQEIGEVIGDAS